MVLCSPPSLLIPRLFVPSTDVIFLLSIQWEHSSATGFVYILLTNVCYGMINAFIDVVCGRTWMLVRPRRSPGVVPFEQFIE